jgi:hypothetical protein
VHICAYVYTKIYTPIISVPHLVTYSISKEQYLEVIFEFMSGIKSLTAVHGLVPFVGDLVEPLSCAPLWEIQ